MSRDYTTARVIVDLVALSIALVMAVRAMPHVRRASAVRAGSGMAGALMVHLVLAEREWVTAIELDLAYVALTLCVTVATKGRWELLATPGHRRPPDESGATWHSERILAWCCGPTIALYFAFEFLFFGTIFSEGI